MGFYSDATLIKDVQRHGVHVRTPCVVQSEVQATVIGEREVRLGLISVWQLGEAWAKAIVEARGFRAFRDVAEVVVHPLSGVTEPSSFDLATGRLCVMASRHKVGLVLVGRDHLGDTLEEYLPVADQAVGLPDEAGRGHAQNWAVWEWLRTTNRIARC